MVGPLYKKTVTVVVDKVDGFRIIRVFVNPIPNVAVNHIIKNPENVPEDRVRLLRG